MSKAKKVITATGEIVVQAMTVSHDGKRRKIDLDHPLQQADLPIRVREMESTIPCGLRVDWIDAKGGDGYPDIDLDCGAGCGSPWIELKYGPREFAVDARDIIHAIIAWADTHPRPPIPEE